LIRWKNGGQVFTPPSICPRCQKRILWFDNIPVLSFLILKGKCRFCRKPISLQYPLVEGATSILFGISSLFFEPDLFLLISSFCFLSFLVLFFVSDLKWRLLPHPFNNLFILSGLFFSFCFWGHQFSFSYLFFSAENFLTMGALLFVLTRFIPNGVGGGDVKMVAGLAAWLGLLKTVLVLILASCSGAIIFLILIYKGKINRRSLIPFGPFLSFSALVVWLYPRFLQNCMRLIP
jgi:prepilin signal peptidase PulO-like enzyme (type II secretory pathway)